MSGAGWRTASTYLVLVGLPFVGLFAILRAGGELEAPPVVAGRWALEAEHAACFGEPTDAFTLDQSGRFLRLRAGAVSADARLEGGRVRAAWTAPGGPCAGREVALEASLEGEAMRGELRATSCGACPSARFEARREAD